MRKRMLAWLLVVAMMLGQVPVSAFAVETAPVTGEKSATEPAKAAETKSTEPIKAGEKSTDPTKAGEETQSTDPTGATEETGAEGTGETSEPTEETSEPTEGTTAPAEETTEPTEAVDEAVAAVEGAIAALPALDALEAMDEASQSAAYEQAQAIADAYDALTEEQQGKVGNFETLKVFLEWFAVPETMADGTAKVTHNGIDTTYYYPIEDVISGQYSCYDGDTVTLLNNATTINTSTFTINKSITLDLNGQTWTLNAGLALNSKITVKNGTLSGEVTIGENGNVTLDNVKGMTVLNAHGGTVTVSNGDGSLDWRSPGKLTVNSGSNYKLTVHGDVSEADVTLNGGSFTKILVADATSNQDTFKNMLPAGYVYQNTSDNTIVNLSTLPDNSLENVTVAECTHGDWKEENGKINCGHCGYTCTHSDVTENNRTCDICNKECTVKEVWSKDGTDIDRWHTSMNMWIYHLGDTNALTLYQDDALTKIPNDIVDETGIMLWVAQGSCFTLNLNGYKLASAGNKVVNKTLIVSGGTLDGYITAITDDEGDSPGHIHLKPNTTVTGLVTFCAYESGKDVLEAGVTLQGGVTTTAAGKYLSDYLAEGTAFQKDGNVVNATALTELEGPVTVVQHTIHNCNNDSSTCACGYVCTHEDTDFSTFTGKCVCGKDLSVAKVTSTAGGTAVTNYYKTFQDAYGAVTSGEGDTLTLTKDISLTKEEYSALSNSTLSKSFTFDLDRHSFQCENYWIFLEENITVKNGTFNNISVDTGYTVTLDTVTTNLVGCHGNLTVNNSNIGTMKVYISSKLEFCSGKVDVLSIESAKAIVLLSGGSYGEIKDSSITTVSLPSLLAKGYAYQNNTDTDKTMVKLSDLTGANTLTNVKVVECTTNTHSYVNGVCEYCGDVCGHTSGVDDDGKCTACKTQMVAQITSGENIQYYLDFMTAYNAMADSGATLTLLADVTLPVVDGSSYLLNKNFTFDLNQHKIELAVSGSDLNFLGTVNVKNGTLDAASFYGTAELENVTGSSISSATSVQKSGSLTVQGTCKIDELYCGDSGKLKVLDGNITKLVFGDGCNVSLSGGSYDQIIRHTVSYTATVGDLLADGYIYRYNTETSKDYIKNSDLTNVTQLENVIVTKCTPHSTPTADGLCGYCNTKLEASVTLGETTTYYASFTDALSYVNKSTASDTVLKPLQNITLSEYQYINGTFTLDLNGKELDLFIRQNSGSLTIQDTAGGGSISTVQQMGYTGTLVLKSGTVKKLESLRTVTISGGSVEELISAGGRDEQLQITGGTFGKIRNTTGNVCDLLASGYAFFNGDTLVNAGVNTLENATYQVKTHTHDYVNGSCACGYICPHTNVDENIQCSECKLTFEAQLWRNGTQVGWLTSITDKFGSINEVKTIQDGDTIKLMKYRPSAILLDKAVVLDLNGHKCDNIIVQIAGVTIQDSTVTADKVFGGQVASLQFDVNVTLGTGIVFEKIINSNYSGITFPEGCGLYKLDDQRTELTWVQTVEPNTPYTVQKNPTNDWTITFTDEDGNTVEKNELVYGKTYTATAKQGTYVPDGTIKYGWKYDSTKFEPVGTSTTSSETFQFTCKQAVTATLGCDITINGYKVTATQNVDIQKADIPASYFTAPTAKKDLVYKGEAQELVTAGTVDTNKFRGHVEYKLEGDNWSKEIPMKMDAGTYKVYWRIVSGNAAYKNYEAKDPITVSITNDWQPVNGTEFTAPTTADGWLKENPTITATDGYELSTGNTAGGNWVESMTGTADSDDTENTISFYLKDKATDAISQEVKFTYKLDRNQAITKTVATVSFLDSNSWDAFTDATFDLLYNKAVTVTVKAKDLGSGVATIEYVESDKALTLAEVQALTNWSVMPTAEGTDDDGNTIGTVTVQAVDGKMFVYYIRITDNVGNVTYFSTDGATFDTAAPTITGVTDGERAYTTRVVTISDNNLDTVTLNGETQNLTDGKLTLPGNVNKIYTIVATDKAGNETTVKVFMSPTASITDGVKSSAGSLTVDNVTSDFQGSLENVKANIQKEQANYNATDAEQEILKEKLDWVNKLLDKLEEVAKAMDTDNIQKVKDITADNVKLEDKTDLEKAKADLNKALTTYDKNLTEAEKKSLNEKIDTIDKALKSIENVENVEKLIGDLPKTITSKDSSAVKEAEKAYNALTEHEKSLVSSTSIKKLQAARKTLNRINGDSTSPNTADESHVNLWFTTLLLSAAALVLLKKRKVVG